MLDLIGITKDYASGENVVKALKGVSVNFRRSEFVSILGPSGCGKTTLLNIIGGLDRYTQGDIVIDGISTKNYKDADWDSYRNHSIGFVFQSYNLIPHQTVAKNVELALTLSGVSKEERRERARAALEKVGLADQVDKKPNQLSGGQMQRVAIARAIVNDPEIILADEPTGALDSETSVQVMDLLQELAATRLVIMVTHNGELAQRYSTRIISLSDGLVVNDTKPFDGKDEPIKAEAENANDGLYVDKPPETGNAGDKGGKAKKQKKPSMSFFTALSLSFNNLITKKARTILTAFAGSIGIIGIALILSLSAGFNGYINDVQRDTLSQYPITITQSTLNYSSALTSFFGAMSSSKNSGVEEYPDDQTVTSNNLIEDLLTGVISSISTNDLKSFKNHLEENPIGGAANAIRYSYNLNMQVYKQTTSLGETRNRRISPVQLPDFKTAVPDDELAGLRSYYGNFESFMRSQPFLSEMIDNEKLVSDQYDVLYGTMPKDDNDAVIVVNEYNQISDVGLYMLGLMDDNDIIYMFHKLMLRMLNPDWSEEKLDQTTFDQLGFGRNPMSYTFDDLMSLKYKVILHAEEFKPSGVTLRKFGEDFPLWTWKSTEEIQQAIDDGEYAELKVSGIVRKKEQASTGSLNSTLVYTKAFTDSMIKRNNALPIVQQLLAEQNKEDYFDITYYGENNESNGKLLSKEEYLNQCRSYAAVDETSPETIYIYPKNFESKDDIAEYINDYNANAPKEKNIKYDDTVGVLMSSVTTIVNAITYVLIAFVSISLVVSSIMISVITHISVLERTKEIGVLRSIGASKNDVSTVFNAETFIIGLTSGVMGIIITLILIIPINIIIESLSGLKGIAALPVWGAFALIGISVLLTVLAGLIPARSASKKDPVVALRTE